MLFPEGDAPLLKTWIVKRLANTSDADADVLADYALALLRHDGDVDSTRKVFEEEIPDFLRDDAAAFTDDVFQAIKYRSYLPGAPPPPPVSRQVPPSAQMPQGVPGAAVQTGIPPLPSFNGVQYTPYTDTPTAFSNPPYRNSKKRSYRDLDAPASPGAGWNPYGDAPFQQAGQPPYKQARRGGRGGRYGDGVAGRGRGPRGQSYASDFGEPAGYNPRQPYQAGPVPAMSLDANDIIQNIQRLQEMGAQMGIPMPQATPLPKPVYSGSAVAPSQPQRKRQPCRDYELKGFCSRGNRCMYDHGTGSVYVPAFPPPIPDEPYDPNNATMTMPTTIPRPGDLTQPFDASGRQMPMPPNQRDFKKGRRRGGGSGGRAAFSHEGPMHDKTKTQIVVENIPEPNFTEDEIRNFFGQFGTIEEVLLRPQASKRIAVVKFDSWAAANTAWKSPKVIFDNRFVKVYWYKDELQHASHNVQQNGSANGHVNGESSTTESEFDIEEFKRKQEEAQKAHEEKTQKREAFEREKRELEEKQRQLMARQEEEKRKLQAKLAGNEVKEASLSPILAKTEADGPKPSQTEALRAKLAQLEEEASSLGLDPDATQDEPSFWRGRGRGRGPYRGRGSFPPRSYRGGYGYRGRGGGAGPDVHAAYAAYSLDNRPKVIAITGVDFTDSTKDEALRQYLFGIGEFTAIHTDPKETHITFKDRKAAEQFMFGVTTNKTIPGVEGTVELAWANSAPKAPGADSDIPMTSGLEDEHAAAKATPEEGEVEEATYGRDARDRDQGDMDYEGGGDWE